MLIIRLPSRLKQVVVCSCVLRSGGLLTRKPMQYIFVCVVGMTDFLYAFIYGEPLVEEACLHRHCRCRSCIPLLLPQLPHLLRNQLELGHSQKKGT